MNRVDWTLLDSPNDLFKKGFRPLQPFRRVFGLLILEEVRDVTGEELLQQWIEIPVLQYFTGEELFHWDLPILNEELQTCKAQLSAKGLEFLKSAIAEVNKT